MTGDEDKGEWSLRDPQGLKGRELSLDSSYFARETKNGGTFDRKCKVCIQYIKGKQVFKAIGFQGY